MRLSRSVLSVLALLALATAPRPAAAAWPHEPFNGNVAVCTAVINQTAPASVSDGAGGTIVTWNDSRSGTSYDIYAQRINAAGVPQWAADGVALSTAAGDQAYPTILADGAGGAGGANIYAQRIDAGGAAQWTANGVVLCAAADFQFVPTIVSDGAGGAIVTWNDYRSGTNYDI